MIFSTLFSAVEMEVEAFVAISRVDVTAHIPLLPVTCRSARPRQLGHKGPFCFCEEKLAVSPQHRSLTVAWLLPLAFSPLLGPPAH